MKQEKTKSKKRLIYYMILAVSVLILVAATVLTVVFVTKGQRNVLELPEQQDPIDPDPSTPSDGEEDKPSVPSGGETARFLSPVSAEEILGYSEYNAIFDNVVAAGMIERHDAVDILAAAGTEVRAMADGEVVLVSEILGYDTLIRIEHDGVTVDYRFVKPLETLKEGDKVKQGDKIGTVEEANGTEAALGAHIHLSMETNGERIDPTQYLPAKTEEK